MRVVGGPPPVTTNARTKQGHSEVEPWVEMSSVCRIEETSVQIPVPPTPCRETGVCICPSAEWVPSDHFPGRRWELRPGISAKGVFGPGVQWAAAPHQQRSGAAHGLSGGAP